MTKITFYPLGNADTTKIDLANGRTLLFDYANIRDPDDDNDLQIDLPAQLRRELAKAGRKMFDAVAFTHLDDDHVTGAPDFFFLEHAAKYQDGDRIKIEELWVPAAAIIETGLSGDKRVIQREARHRLLKGKGVRVFSRPALLKKWLDKHGLSVADRKHLITDAGEFIPGFTRSDDGLEFFVHSPFAMRTDNGEVVDRNRDALVVQATFVVSGVETKAILASDIDHEVIADIVRVTRRNGNSQRLEWHLVKLPHHCSYLSLGPEKGKWKTEPTPRVKWLYENQGQERARAISTSKPIPSVDTEQPPHQQAAKYYREVVAAKNGEFLVTMEHPTQSSPKPLVVEITNRGATVRKTIVGGAAIVTTRPSPRAGLARL